MSEYKEKVKYLGITFTPQLKWDSHITDRTNSCKGLLMRISAIIGHTFGPRPLYISWIFKAIILPRLCYGSIIWANKTSSISKNKLTRGGLLVLC